MEAADHPRRKYEFARNRLSRLRAETAEIEAQMKEVAAKCTCDPIRVREWLRYAKSNAIDTSSKIGATVCAQNSQETA